MCQALKFDSLRIVVVLIHCRMLKGYQYLSFLWFVKLFIHHAISHCRKSTGLGISFMLFGCLIFLWKEWKVMGSGRFSVLMRLQGWPIVGVLILRDCTPNTKEM